MPSDINRVIVSGHMTRDAELRQTASGMAILSFGLAVNDRRRNAQTGEWEDYPNFLDCSMFGKRAESLSEYLSKGMQLTVEGKLRYSKWEKDGIQKSKVEIIAEEVVLPPRQQPPAQPQTYPQQYQPQPSIYDEDILF